MNSKDLTAELNLTDVTDMLFRLTAEEKLFFTLEGREGVSETYFVDNLMITRPRQKLGESSSDYAPTANIVGGDALGMIENLSVDECAAKCSATPGCRSINFCHNPVTTPVATCSLMAEFPADPSASTSRHVGCWNYRRLSQKDITGDKGDRVSWLVIGLITGTFLGIAGRHAYGCFKAISRQRTVKMARDEPGTWPASLLIDSVVPISSSSLTQQVPQRDKYNA